MWNTVLLMAFLFIFFPACGMVTLPYSPLWNASTPSYSRQEKIHEDDGSVSSGGVSYQQGSGGVSVTGQQTREGYEIRYDKNGRPVVVPIGSRRHNTGRKR